MKKYVFVSLVLMGLLGVGTSAYAASFVVDSNLDIYDINLGDGICDAGVGTCTLRAALSESVNTVGPDTITFSEPMTITLSQDASLYVPPDVTVTGLGPDQTIIQSGVLLDKSVFQLASGTTLSGVHLNPKSESAIEIVDRSGVVVNDVEIVGDTGIFGITISGSDDVTISNSHISQTERGIAIMDTSSNIVITGNTLHQNDAGIAMQDVSNVTIGGSEEGEGNTITESGSDGIFVANINTEYVTIEGNSISGSVSETGMLLKGAHHTVHNNLVFNNTGPGILFDEVDQSVITGNTVYNNGQGIAVYYATSITIGGLTPDLANYIYGTMGEQDAPFGIFINRSPENIQVIGNVLGSDRNGLTDETTANSIGIFSIVARSLIMNNSVRSGFSEVIGIAVIGGEDEENGSTYANTVATLLENQVYGMQSPIDIVSISGDFQISDLGPNPNDPGDADVGSNDYLNTPVIHSVNHVTGEVVYSVDVPAGTYRIEFFSGAAVGQAEEYVGYDTFISTGVNKQQTYTFDPKFEGYISATTTIGLGNDEYGATSELSQAYVPLVEPKRRTVSGSVSPTYLAQQGIVLDQSLRPSTLPTTTTDTCPADQILTQNMRAGARNGKYHPYTKAIVTEVKILQAHMNRLGFNSGPVDGILGPITDGAIKRMQTFLGTKADGMIGPITRGLINNSCGGAGLKKSL